MDKQTEGAESLQTADDIALAEDLIDRHTRLRDELWDPDKFLAEQKANNPILADLMK